MTTGARLVISQFITIRQRQRQRRQRQVFIGFIGFVVDHPPRCTLEKNDNRLHEMRWRVNVGYIILTSVQLCTRCTKQIRRTSRFCRNYASNINHFLADRIAPSVIGYWHHSVVRLSVTLSIVTLKVGVGVWKLYRRVPSRELPIHFFDRSSSIPSVPCPFSLPSVTFSPSPSPLFYCRRLPCPQNPARGLG